MLVVVMLYTTPGLFRSLLEGAEATVEFLNRPAEKQTRRPCAGQPFSPNPPSGCNLDKYTTRQTFLPVNTLRVGSSVIGVRG